MGEIQSRWLCRRDTHWLHVSLMLKAQTAPLHHGCRMLSHAHIPRYCIIYSSVNLACVHLPVRFCSACTTCCFWPQLLNKHAFALFWALLRWERSPPRLVLEACALWNLCYRVLNLLQRQLSAIIFPSCLFFFFENKYISSKCDLMIDICGCVFPGHWQIVGVWRVWVWV